MASSESSEVSFVANELSDMDFSQCIMPVPRAPTPGTEFVVSEGHLRISHSTKCACWLHIIELESLAQTLAGSKKEKN